MAEKRLKLLIFPFVCYDYTQIITNTDLSAVTYPVRSIPCIPA